ncbi:MAG: DUF308 domain-containing protein [Fusicatenibacter sp.]
MSQDGTHIKKHSFTWVQGCWLASAVLLLCASLISFSTDALADISTYLGLPMLFTGCINIWICHKKQDRLHGVHWLLADGMCTALLSLFPLFNQLIQAAMIPFFFGVWELFTGILKMIDAYELKKEPIKGWAWFRFIGTIEIISGIASLLRPVEEFVGMNMVVGIILLVQSCSYFLKIWIYPQIAKPDKKEI